MFTHRKLSCSLVVLATLALYACTTKCTAAHGGGGGHGGGGFHGGGFHGGENRGGHGGEFNNHPYRPSEGHYAHHNDEHHDANHGNWDHHHEGWHNGGWGYGGYGGWGYGGYAGWGGFGYGGDTIINNTDNVTPVSYESDNGSDDASNDGSNDDGNGGDSNGGNNPAFATDNWPELGLATYAGQYGASQGQVVLSVMPNSAADKAGLVAGDVILTFNGQPVPSANDLESAMCTAGGKFEVSVWDARTGRKSELGGTFESAAAPSPTKSAAVTPKQ